MRRSFSKGISFSNEMAELANVVEKGDSCPFKVALLAYLNKVNECLDSKNEEIMVLKGEIASLKEEKRERELLALKITGDKEKQVLKGMIEKAEKTVRIVGIEQGKTSNRVVLEKTINKLNTACGSSMSFESTKLLPSKDGKFTSINLGCVSVDQKQKIERAGRSVGLSIRQQIPAPLVGTIRDIREAFMKLDKFRGGHLMVKLHPNRIAISARPDSSVQWKFVENLSLPISKRVLQGGLKQTLISKVANLENIHIPESFC